MRTVKMDPKNGKFTMRDFESALLVMDPEDRRMIKNLARQLDRRMKARGYYRGQKIMFGKLSSFELLARLGIFINKRGIVKK